MNKAQKIREEVERLQNELIQEREKGYGSDEDDFCILELQNVLTYIDSLEEEPVSNIWHDASEKSSEPENVVIINPSDNTGEVLTRCTSVYQGRIWAYTSDLLKINKPTSTVYVVTRSEEHADYVEKAFFDKDKANKYCDQFKGNEDEYARYITKVEVTLWLTKIN